MLVLFCVEFEVELVLSNGLLELLFDNDIVLDWDIVVIFFVLFVIYIDIEIGLMFSDVIGLVD